MSDNIYISNDDTPPIDGAAVTRYSGDNLPHSDAAVPHDPAPAAPHRKPKAALQEAHRNEVEVRTLLVIAKYISLIFTPFYLPLMGLMALFVFTDLRSMPWFYQFMVLAVAYCFTVLLPQTFIHVYRHHHGWPVVRLLSREGRYIPYCVSLICYCSCYHIMIWLHMPHIMSSIVVAAIAVQLATALVNVWWKISIHTAAIGGTTGAVVAFSLIFGFNPLWWFCVLILLAGVVGTGRMLLRIHTLGEVVGGYLIGVVAGFFTVMTF